MFLFNIILRVITVTIIIHSLKVLKKNNSKYRGKRLADEDDFSQEVDKCCPRGYRMDDWYNCIKITHDRFVEELLEIGGKDKEKYVIINTRKWVKCPINQRKEFEVLHIPRHKNKTAYVFTDTHIDYDITEQREEINFTGFREIKYSCLEVSQDSQTMTALVCSNQEENSEKSHFIRKCCPYGQGLTRNFTSCEDINHTWIPPRKVIDHKSEKMTGSYKPIFGHELCSSEEIQIVDTAHAITTDGHFKTMSEMTSLIAYHCVDTLVLDNDQEEVKVVAVMCLQQGCTSQACVSKCCPKDRMIVEDDSLCAPANKSSHLWSHHDKLYDSKRNIIPSHLMENITVEYSHHFINNVMKFPSIIPDCEKIIIIDNSNNDTLFILQNGSFYHKEYGITTDYCVDNTLNSLGDLVQIVITCIKDMEQERHSLMGDGSWDCMGDFKNLFSLLNSVCCITSCIFLIITFFVYIRIPELDNLHGKIVLSNVFSIFLLTAYLLLVYNASNYIHGVLCAFIGYSGYFLTMSMFSWMTIMSFDLCWTFKRAMVPSKDAALVKFLTYSVVAWGSSAVMTMAIILADLVMDDQGTTKPNVGKQKCFLQEQSQGLYLQLPIMFLMIVNGIFFIITTITLYR